MTLKLRLTLLVVGVMTMLLVAASLLRVASTVRDTLDEVQASVGVVHRLLPDEFPRAGAGAAPMAAAVALVRSLGEVRHVRVAVHDASGERIAVSRAPEPVSPLIEALFHTRASQHRLAKSFTIDGRTVGHFVVIPDASDEVSESARDYARDMAMILFATAVLGSLVYWAVGRALAPLRAILQALRSLEIGHLGTRLAAFPQGELAAVPPSFNRTAASLENAVSAQQELLGKLIAMEERTRRSIAHDLHDELSPDLVVMRSHVAVIARACARDELPKRYERDVGALDSYLQRLLRKVRELLESLHPPELQSLGLEQALRALVEQRRRDCTEATIELHLEGALTGLSAALDTSVYRIVQECLTNAYKHSSCSRISVEVSRRAEREKDEVRITVRNNSAGRVPGMSEGGLGVLGIRERALALGGTSKIGPTADGGWEVAVVLPVWRGLQ